MERTRKYTIGCARLDSCICITVVEVSTYTDADRTGYNKQHVRAQAGSLASGIARLVSFFES
jgi:hypothetical protein